MPPSPLKPLWGLFSDLHFQPASLPRIVQTSHWLTTLFRTHNVTQIICLGDVLNTRESVSVQALSKAAEMFRELREIADVHVVLGNHDLNLKHGRGISSLDFLEGVGGVRVYREVERVGLDGWETVMVPWHERHSLVVEELEKISEEEKNRMVLFGHLAVNGAIMNTRSGTKHTDGPLTAAHLNPFRAAFLGHFHHHQRLGTSNAWYCGATMQHHYGDANDRGRGIILFDPSQPTSMGSVRHDYIQNPEWDVFRSVALESLEGRIGEGVGGDLKEFGGKRVQVVCPAGSIERYDAVRKRLVKAGAEAVVRRIVLREVGLTPRVDGAVAEGSSGTDGEGLQTKEQFSREGMATLIPNFLAAVHSAGAFPKNGNIAEYASKGLALINSTPNLSLSTSQKDFLATIHTLTIQNFLSLQGTLHLPFHTLTPGIRYILGPNGSGKSLLLESIVWALFGRLLRPNATAEGVVNSIINKNCQVSIAFTNGYTITRFRKFKAKGAKTIGLQVLKDGVELPEFERGEHAASQAALERDILGCDFGVFTKCVMLGDVGRGAGNFLNMEKGERRALLEEVLGFGAFDEVLEGIRARMKVVLEEVVREEGRVRGLEGKLEGLERGGELRKMDDHVLRVELESVKKEEGEVVEREVEFVSEKKERRRLRDETKRWHDVYVQAVGLQRSIELSEFDIQHTRQLQRERLLASQWIIAEDERVAWESTYATLEERLHAATREILTLSSDIAAYHKTHSHSLSNTLLGWLQRLWQSLTSIFDKKQDKHEAKVDNLLRILTLSEKREQVAREMHDLLSAKESAAQHIRESKDTISKVIQEVNIPNSSRFVDIICNLVSQNSKGNLSHTLAANKASLKELLKDLSMAELEQKAAEYEQYRLYAPEWEARLSEEFSRTKSSLSQRADSINARLASLQEEAERADTEIAATEKSIQDVKAKIDEMETELKYIRFWQMAFEKSAKKDVPNIREWLVAKAVEEMNVLVREKLDLVIGDTGDEDVSEEESEPEEPESAEPRRGRRKKSAAEDSDEDVPAPRKKRATTPKLRPENFQNDLKFTSALTLPPSISLLSSGQLKRISISILLSLFQLCRRNSHFRPDFLFLDEAFDTLDERGRRHAILLLEEIVRVEGIRVAGVVSHNLTEDMIEGRGVLRVERGVRGTRISDSEGVVVHEVDKVD